MKAVRAVHNTPLRLLACLCLTVSIAHADSRWVAPASADLMLNPVKADEESNSAAADIYDDRCWKCHGDNGIGNGPKARDLSKEPPKLGDREVQDQSDGALYWKIENGRKPMPDYGGRLSPTKIWNLVNYMRTFKSNAGTPDAKR